VKKKRKTVFTIGREIRVEIRTPLPQPTSSPSLRGDTVVVGTFLVNEYLPVIMLMEEFPQRSKNWS